jgi:hypothetical protein
LHPAARLSSRLRSTMIDGKTTQSIDRTLLNSNDAVKLIWRHLGLPEHALDSISLPGTGLGAPSSFKLGILAQTSITLSALAAALVHSQINDTNIPKVDFPLQHAIVESDSHTFRWVHSDSRWFPRSPRRSKEASRLPWCGRSDQYSCCCRKVDNAGPGNLSNQSWFSCRWLTFL